MKVRCIFHVFYPDDVTPMDCSLVYEHCKTKPKITPELIEQLTDAMKLVLPSSAEVRFIQAIEEPDE